MFNMNICRLFSKPLDLVRFYFSFFQRFFKHKANIKNETNLRGIIIFATDSPSLNPKLKKTKKIKWKFIRNAFKNNNFMTKTQFVWVERKPKFKK